MKIKDLGEVPQETKKFLLAKDPEKSYRLFRLEGEICGKEVTLFLPMIISSGEELTPEEIKELAEFVLKEIK